MFIKEDRRREKRALTPIGYMAASLLVVFLLLGMYGGIQKWQEWRKWRRGGPVSIGTPMPPEEQPARSALTENVTNAPETQQRIKECFIEARDWFWDGLREDPAEAERLYVNIPHQVIEEKPGDMYILTSNMLDAVVEDRQERRERGIYWQGESLGGDTVEILAFSEDGKIATVANYFPNGWISRCYDRESSLQIKEVTQPPGWMEGTMYYASEDNRWKLGDVENHENSEKGGKTKCE